MVLDMNISLEGITDEFLEELEELVEDMRVEYFIINPQDENEVEKAQKIAKSCKRFKYTLPIELVYVQDENCVAFRISSVKELELIQDMPLVIESKNLDDVLIEALNNTLIKGIVLDAKESDNRLKNFAYSVSHNSLKDWTKKGITDTDYNKLALQSDYPSFTYDELFDSLLKDMSDLTFRAEQTIAAGGTRTVLKTFKMM